MHVFTKFIDTDFVDMLNVEIDYRENNSLVEILIVKNVESQIKINDINEFLLRIDFEYIFMISRRDILVIDNHFIVDIQNVLDKNSDFLTILFDEQKILQTHVDDEKKSFYVNLKEKFR